MRIHGLWERRIRKVPVSDVSPPRPRRSSLATLAMALLLGTSLAAQEPIPTLRVREVKNLSSGVTSTFLGEADGRIFFFKKDAPVYEPHSHKVWLNYGNFEGELLSSRILRDFGIVTPDTRVVRVEGKRGLYLQATLLGEGMAKAPSLVEERFLTQEHRVNEREVRRLQVLDVILGNGDRHGSNLVFHGHSHGPKAAPLRPVALDHNLAMATRNVVAAGDWQRNFLEGFGGLGGGRGSRQQMIRRGAGNPAMIMGRNATYHRILHGTPLEVYVGLAEDIRSRMTDAYLKDLIRSIPREAISHGDPSMRKREIYRILRWRRDHLPDVFRRWALKAPMAEPVRRVWESLPESLRQRMALSPAAEYSLRRSLPAAGNLGEVYTLFRQTGIAPDLAREASVRVARTQGFRVDLRQFRQAELGFALQQASPPRARLLGPAAVIGPNSRPGSQPDRKPFAPDTRPSTIRKLDRLQARVGQFRRDFVQELHRLHESGALREDMGRMAHGLARHGSFFATVYLFTLVRLLSTQPHLDLEQSLSRAGELAFSREALTSFGTFLLASHTVQSAGSELKRAARRAGRLAFAGVGLGLGMASAGVGIVAADATLQGFEIAGQAHDWSAFRDAELAAYPGDHRARLARLSATYFDTGIRSGIAQAFDPLRLDYQRVLVEGGFMLAGGLAAGATGLGTLGTPAAMLGSAAVGSHLLEGYRTLTYDPVRFHAWIRDTVETRGNALWRTEPGGTIGEHEAALAGLARAESDTFDALAARSELLRGQVQSVYVDLVGLLHRESLAAVGDAGKRRERDLLLNSIVERHGLEAADRALAALPEAMRDTPRPESHWSGEVVFDRAPAVAEASPGALEHMRSRLREASSRLQRIGGGGARSNPGSGLAGMYWRMGSLWKSISQLHALERGRAAMRSQARVRRAFLEQGAPIPTPDFQVLGRIHRKYLDRRQTHLELAGRQLRDLLARGLDENSMLTGAAEHWDRALDHLRQVERGAPEAPAETREESFSGLLGFGP